MFSEEQSCRLSRGGGDENLEEGENRLWRRVLRQFSHTAHRTRKENFSLLRV